MKLSSALVVACIAMNVGASSIRAVDAALKAVASSAPAAEVVCERQGGSGRVLPSVWNVVCRDPSHGWGRPRQQDSALDVRIFALKS